MIKCIIFDLGNVIIRNHPARAIGRLEKHCTLPGYKGDTLFVAPKKVHRRFSTGKISRAEFYRRAVKESERKNLPRKEFERVYTDMFTSNVPVQRLAKKLKRKYKVMLLSNTDASNFGSISKRFPIMKIFGSCTLSYKVGYLKPHRKIYLAAVRKSGFRANECVFIDDRKANAEGARKFGMHGIHYTTNVALRSSLKRLGVKF